MFHQHPNTNPNRLHDAIMAGNEDEVRRLITEENVEVDKVHTQNGLPPLAFAAKCASLSIVQFLIEKGASLSMPKGKKRYSLLGGI